MLVWLRRWKVGRKETEMEEEVISSKVFFIALVVLSSCHGSRAAGAVAVVYSGITLVTLIHERVVGGGNGVYKWKDQTESTNKQKDL